jgi:hypothetical protein
MFAGMKITTTWRNDNPNTIWNVLARKLGREPTNAEVKAELDRITSEVMIDMAGKGKLRHQRRRP